MLEKFYQNFSAQPFAIELETKLKSFALFFKKAVLRNFIKIIGKQF